MNNPINLHVPCMVHGMASGNGSRLHAWFDDLSTKICHPGGDVRLLLKSKQHFYTRICIKLLLLRSSGLSLAAHCLISAEKKPFSTTSNVEKWNQQRSDGEMQNPLANWLYVLKHKPSITPCYNCTVHKIKKTRQLGSFAASVSRSQMPGHPTQKQDENVFLSSPPNQTRFFLATSESRMMHR